MIGINDKLKKLENQGRAINIALAGIGQMGTGMISHLRDIKSFRIAAVGNKDVEKSLKKLLDLGYREKEICQVTRKGNINKECLNGSTSLGNCTQENFEKLKNNFSCHNYLSSKTREMIQRAMQAKNLIITDDVGILSCIEGIDVVMDATGSTDAGAQIAFQGLLNKKHVVTLNVEADTAVGPILKKMADHYGVIYTLAAGDEPAALKELYDFADALNLKVVAAGKGKNNPLDREANPSTLEEYSRVKGSSAKMMTTFVDGTKSMVEMACFSNATGIIPDCRGMHAPKANVADLTSIFSLKKQGGILDKTGVVDFAIGNVAPGVFLVYTTEQEVIRKELKYLLFGDGPNYLLYRPFHLASIEAPLSAARAYLYKEPTIVPKNGLISEIITVAKKDLEPGKELDGIGGYDIYGLIELASTAKKEDLLPIGLAEGAVLTRKISKGQPIQYGDINLKEDSFICYLRKIQDQTQPVK